MKRTVAIIAGVVSLGVLAYVGSRLWAQPAAQPVAPAQTRIAVVNVSKAIKDYDKWKAYREEFKGAAKGYEETAKKMKEEFDRLMAQGQAPTATEEVKVQVEKSIKKLRSDMQEMQDDFKQKMGKKEMDQMQILYKELQIVVERIAQSRGLEMVLQYNDPFSGDVANVALSVQRRLTSDGAIPLYTHPQLDITADVAATLNNWYHSAAPQTPAATGTH